MRSINIKYNIGWTVATSITKHKTIINFLSSIVHRIEINQTETMFLQIFVDIQRLLIRKRLRVVSDLWESLTIQKSFNCKIHREFCSHNYRHLELEFIFLNVNVWKIHSFKDEKYIDKTWLDNFFWFYYSLRRI